MSDTPWAAPGSGEDPTAVPPPPPVGGPPPPPPPPAPLSSLPPPSGWSGGRRIPLRPMRFGEILDAAFKLFRLTFVQVSVLVVITLGAFTIFQVLVQPPTPGMLADPADFDQLFSSTDLVRYGISGLIAIFTSLFVLPLVRGAATGIAIEADRGGDTSWQAGLRTARGLAGRLIGLSFLLLLVGIVGLLLAVGIIGAPLFLLIRAELVPLAVVWGILSVLVALVAVLVATALVYLAVPVLLIERLGPVAALRRSIALVRPQLLRVIGLVLLSVLLLGAIGAVLGIGATPMVLVGGTVGQLGTAVVNVLAYVISVPFEANIALLLYVDCRVRSEGLDVAVLTAELDDL